LQASIGGLAATGLNDYFEQAANAAEAIDPPRVLIGASLGGLLALSTAARTRCSALVLINPLPPLPEARALPAPTGYPSIIPWRQDASLESTRRALPDADDLACLYAFRRWRDESGAVLNTARTGVMLASPDCPTLVLISNADAEVPPSVSAALAARLHASYLHVEASHTGPLLGRRANACAAQAVAWLNGLREFRSD
jgi:pimeloyl-ACP methyl ester carboxylesterase